VLAFADPALAGRFAIGAPCRFPLQRADKLPTLVIVSSHDLWFDADHEPRPEGAAGKAAWAGMNVSLFESDGVLHDALIYEESRVTLWNFLVRRASSRVARRDFDLSLPCPPPLF